MYKWKPNKAQKEEFHQKMLEIEEFCKNNDIYQSRKGDSYYFELKGKNYRVSNHTIEASNAAAFDDEFGQIRELYHPEGREENTVYITAGKTRIIEIYKNLLSGATLDKRGRVIE